MSDKNGGPAFPYSALQPDEKSAQLAGTMYADNCGMSLRDYFAAQLFPALLRAYLHDNKCGIGVDHAPKNVAAHAYS